MSTGYGVPDSSDGGQNRWLVDAVRAVQGPGTALQWYGMISVFLSVMALMVFLVSPETLTERAYKRMVEAQAKREPENRTPLPPYKQWAQQAQLELVVWSLLWLGSSFVVTIGGMKMKQLTGYGWAVAGSVLSILPVTNACCCAGLPIGLWALVALFNSDMRLAFRRVGAAGGLEEMLANPPPDDRV